ncbi:MAG: hypothetical protein MJ207_01520 [Bacilli bacterium]|nr:hypothetical protein [Bacilli bacterium]
MKVRHFALLILGATSFCVSCNGDNTADQKFLNTINSVVDKNKDKINTCKDAVDFIQDAGYDIEEYKLAKDTYCFAYDWAGKEFVVMNGDDIIYSPKNYARKQDTYNYFKFTSHYDASSIYSQYLTKDFQGADMLVVTTGLDMGSNWNVKNLIYNNTSTVAKNIYLNTFSDYLTITAPTDDITHYGDANNVFVVEMGDEHAFHANGVYAYIQPSSGHIYLESGSETDLFELKEGSTAKIHYVDGATIEATINAPAIPTEFDLDYISVNDAEDITLNDAETKKKTNFFRLESDVNFGKTGSDNAWFVKNNFFLDLNGHKISFTGNATSLFTADGGDQYHAGIVLDARPENNGGVNKDLECYIVDTQPTLYERPSIELNDCSIIVSGSAEHSAL